MKYNIEITYDTGDSFHTEYDVKQNLELEVKNLDIAKENLQRIENHYKFYEAKKRLERNWYFKDKKQKSLDEEIIKSAPGCLWYVKKYPDGCINLVLDDGKKWQISAFWCGYFEKLTSAEIIFSKDGDLKFTVLYI